MVGTFIGLTALARLPIGLALLAAAVAGALLGGEGFALRYLVEGTFLYLDAMLIIVTAMAFMAAMRSSGALVEIARQLVRTFGRRPVVLLPSLMVLAMLPGMLAGSSTAAVLTTGALVAPVLMSLGLSKLRAGALIAMAGVYGMVAPPVNVPVMLIGAGIDIPYVGFELPLVAASFPLAVATAYWMGWPLFRRRKDDLSEVLAALDEASPPTDDRIRPLQGFWAWTPLVWVVLAMTASRLPVPWLPDLGLPLIFALGAVMTLLASRVPNWAAELRGAVRDALPVLGILVGVGAFIQVLTLTGGRGWVVVSLLSLPAAGLYLAAATGVPLFGAISAYGAASVLGVPLVLALLDAGDVIVITAAMSLLAGLGDLMPPTALAGIFAAQVVGEKKYTRMLAVCLGPALLTVAYAMMLLLVS
ncbi:MAG: TRAP transporter large permease subunit [Firmicutes bacterium]|nr:TRAP transporter large permease subunit [Bacillota bacterium]